jgi:nicotinate phosphoribosyltransferase
VNLAALGIDLYQATTLVAHAALGRLHHRLSMAFFFREMPRHRNYVVFAGLRQIVEWCEALRFGRDEMGVFRAHPVLGPALRRHPEVLEALSRLDGFEGEIEALPEGTLAFAGPGRTTAGEPLRAGDQIVPLYTPLLQVRADIVRAKLVETPWLSRVNHLSMVASKAARIVFAAGGLPVVEFGQRRTHPDAAIDAAYAAYLAGCAATSNVAAHARYGIPVVGTMDHFAVQASEEPGVSPAQTERRFFEVFVSLYPEANTLLVDTYDTARGLASAARAAGARLQAVRIDCNVTPEEVRRARALLDAEGAPQAKIFVSDRLDEWRVRELAAAGAGGFGVGENLTCSPDSATGIGAVAKVVENGYGKQTMKVARGSGKIHLPGWLQVWRASDHDLVALAEEAGPSGARPLLTPVWRGRARMPLPTLEEARAHVAAQVAALPPHLRALETDHGRPWPLVASDALVDRIRTLVREAFE